MNRKLLALAGIASAILWASAANAVTVSIGLQQAGFFGGAIQNVGVPGIAGTASFGGSFGTFLANNIFGQGNPPLSGQTVLQSGSADVSTSGAGTLKVYVTTSGNTSPTGLVPFLSSFTTNLLSTGWTLTLETFLNANNSVFGTTTPLGSAAFSGIGTSIAATLAAAGSGPWSVTALYTIVANGMGSVNSTINVSAVPLPAALPLFATGLLGLWALRRKRKSKSAKSHDLAVA